MLSCHAGPLPVPGLPAKPRPKLTVPVIRLVATTRLPNPDPPRKFAADPPSMHNACFQQPAIAEPYRVLGYILTKNTSPGPNPRPWMPTASKPGSGIVPSFISFASECLIAL